MNEDSYIVLFDGHCNLCNGWVRFIRKRDRRHRFRFTPLQLHLNVVDSDNKELSTVVLLHNDRRYEKSEAAIRILFALGGFWRLAWLFFGIPRRLRDAVYDFVAAHRHQWFGKTDHCDLDENATMR
ncbi:MAG: DUF393 domain-containing protein [Deltaproteobacteria bacterium]|nr:DUF393 domain-containing protein [Deltaproteobacteria bacterium]MBN2672122.1 DUF393 domain-containing protein [Deltaproteobacteria bacterium]